MWATVSQAVKYLSSKLQGILELLVDGRVHKLNELKKGTELSERQTAEIVAFLTKYGFLETNNENETVRISKAAKKLLAQPI